MFEEKLSSAQMNHVESELIKAIDGYGGGTYAPSSLITIGGSGLKLTAGLLVTGSDALVSGNVVVGTNLTVSGLTTTQGVIVNGEAEFTLGVITLPGGTSQFQDNVSFTSAAAITASGGITVNTNPIAISSNGNTVSGTIEFSGVTTMGNMIRRVTIGSNSNSTYNVSTSDIVKCNVATSLNVYTAGDVGASNGCLMIFYVPINTGVNNTVYIKDSGGITLALLKSLGSSAPGLLPQYVELVRVGGAWEVLRGVVS